MPSAMAVTTAAAVAAASHQKPWRYYFVMAFPLSNPVPKEKLVGMLELTESLEKREEEYLLTKLDREGATEPPRRNSPMARYAAKTLQWSSVFMLLVVVAWAVTVYCTQRSSMGSELDPRVFVATYIATASLGLLNAALFTAIFRNDTLLLRGAVLLMSLAIGCVVFVLDELNAVEFSQRQLAQAIEQPRESFTSGQIELVLNGDVAPSLWHRFFVDGPAWFLVWLETHCVKKPSAKTEGVDDSLVDSSDFFAPLWRSRARICTRRCLHTHLLLELVVRVLLTVMIVVIATQLVLTATLLWTEYLDITSLSSKSTAEQAAVSRKRKREARRAKKKKGKALDMASMALPISFTGVVRVATVALALTGTVLTVVSTTLLSSCSFVGPTETWALALVAGFGVLQIIVAVLANLLWHQRFATSVLIGGLALESYAMAALTELCTTLSSPALLGTSSGDDGPSNSSTYARLRDVYDTIFQQSCQPIKHWRLHVCVLENAPPSPHGALAVDLFDSAACQNEFGALLTTSAQHSIVLLWWMMAAQVVVLLWLLLPSVTALAHTAMASVANFFTSSRQMETELVYKDSDLRVRPKRKKLWKHTTLEMKEAREFYLASVKRKDAATIATEKKAFDAEWENLSNGGGTKVMIFTHQFQAIVRTLMLRRLTVSCKMDVSLSLSSDGKQLFAKIFASDNLLMTTLCQSAAAYKLQLADAVDPGERFWRDKRELKNDAKVLDAHSVHQKLRLLELQGVVSRKEAEIFPVESMARVSGRVQALLRTYRWKSGVLTVRNRHPPFVEYAPHTHLQYLYKKYPTRLDTATTTQQRRAAVLRTIDCLRLARQILDAEFDLDLAQRRGLIHDFTELHSASRFDTTSKQSLLSSWIAFWRPEHLPGEVEPETSWLRSQLSRLSPFRQPLQGVRDYFGECIAFYFAWLAFYNKCLLIPALAVAILLATRVLDASLFVELVMFCRHGSDASVRFDMPTSAFVFGLAVVAWGFVFAKFWERRSVWYQLEWGMSDLDELTHADRVNFRGIERRNPVTQQLEVYFPESTRVQRQVMSALVVVAVGVIHLVVCLLLLLVQGVLSQWLGLRLAVGVSMLVLALLVLWNGDAISAISHQLSEWENHQSERDFQRSVILKVCVLQVFNSYGPLLLAAFGLNHIDSVVSFLPIPQRLVSAFQERITPHVGVVIQLQVLLLLIFTTRITSHLLMMAHGLVHDTLRARSKPNAPPSVESELALQAYRGSYEDYTEIWVQLGLVVIFSSVFPLAAVFAFVECALELRLDALDLCLFLQRPTPEKADGIGPWKGCIQAVLKLGLLVNLALLYFMADNYADWSLVRRVGAFLGSVLVTWLASELLCVLLPSKSREVESVLARHEFLVDRYFGSDDDSLSTSDKVAQSSIALSENERKALSDRDVEGSDDPEAKTVLDVMAPSHYKKRMELLHRLNVAVRQTQTTIEQPAKVVRSTPDATPLQSEYEPPHEEEEERAVVGYFVRTQPPSEQVVQPQEEELPPPIVEVEAPLASPTPSVEPFTRTALTGMEAIHVAAERERFDFAQDTGWQGQRGSTGASAATASRRGSLTSLSKRFSLFRKRRVSVDDTPLSPTAPIASPSDIASSDVASPSVAASTAVTSPNAAASSAVISPEPTAPTTTHVTRRPSTSTHTRRNSGRALISHNRDTGSGALPVVQLSGIDAVHEATRRSQFDFSTDPWRDSTGSHHSATL